MNPLKIQTHASRAHSGADRRAAGWLPKLSVIVGTLCITAAAHAAEPALNTTELDKETVGKRGANRFVTPVNQVLTPAGIQVELPEMRPQGIALSPDGQILVTSGKTAELVVVDPVTGAIRQRVALPSAKATEPEPDAVSTHILDPDKEGQLSFTGLVFSPDGKWIYLSNVNGSIKVFQVNEKHEVKASHSIPLPKADAPRRSKEIPAGLAVTPDGKRLYVALNLSNRMAELDTASGVVKRMWDVGVAPYDVALANGKAYVSNWGGRRPDKDSLTGPAGRGMKVRVDTVRHIANEGSVTIIGLGEHGSSQEILVGLHASALAVSPNQRHVVVANAGSDNLSVIDTRTDKIVETIWTKASPADLFGASPNALTFDSRTGQLWVCNGTQNAVAIVRFRPGGSEVLGMVPTAWFPGAIALDPQRKAVYVANTKGIGSTKHYAAGEKVKFNSHQYFGSLSLIPQPNAKQLREHTRQVYANYRRSVLTEALKPARAGQKPKPVPERSGEPSVFKHVVYIIKENRTYDQVFGDLPQGNGDSSLCIFGEKFTPNQHKMVREFTLLDNTYCSGILSADGHQWADTGFATDYMEKSFAGFPRSYPDGMEDDDIDALAYAPSGFLWDKALAHGKSVRIYGEFAITEAHWRDRSQKGAPKFMDFYNDFRTQGDKIQIYSRPAIGSIKPYLATNTVGWHMDIPDVFRAKKFIEELKGYEQSGEFPNLVVICLPNDHTSGTKSQAPTPGAQVADNDLAFGQILEAISHSRFWKETCVFAIEDDPQAGWDHVSGYRTTAYVASPYTKRGAVVSTQYNQTSLLRTMGLMLGLPPMNQMDGSATPMSDCFTEVPDLRPFDAVPNNIPLDELNPEPKKVSNALLRHHIAVSNRLPLKEPDRCPEDALNRILWHAMKGPEVPYPSWAVVKVKDHDDD